jgi:hypothetical protein
MPLRFAVRDAAERTGGHGGARGAPAALRESLGPARNDDTGGPLLKKWVHALFLCQSEQRAAENVGGIESGPALDLLER